MDRLYEAICPPIGTSLAVPIEISPITPNLDLAEEVLGRCGVALELALVLSVDLPQHPQTTVAFVCPATVDVHMLKAEAKKLLHAYEMPAYIFAVEKSTLPMLDHDSQGVSKTQPTTRGGLDVYFSRSSASGDDEGLLPFHRQVYLSDDDCSTFRSLSLSHSLTHPLTTHPLTHLLTDEWTGTKQPQWPLRHTHECTSSLHATK